MPYLGSAALRPVSPYLLDRNDLGRENERLGPLAALSTSLSSISMSSVSACVTGGAAVGEPRMLWRSLSRRTSISQLSVGASVCSAVCWHGASLMLTVSLVPASLVPVSLFALFPRTVSGSHACGETLALRCCGSAIGSVSGGREGAATGVTKEPCRP